ncbi:hypothetical protein LTS18_001499, partial [Coniosporium uncinatum]
MRGGRGGFDSTRGGRGRGRGEGGRGASRGGRGASTNGTRTVAPTTTAPTTAADGSWDTPAAPESHEVEEKPAWDTPATGEGAAEGQYGSVIASNATPATASEGLKGSLVPDGGAKTSWAKLFEKPKPAPALPKAATDAPPTTASAPITHEETTTGVEDDTVPTPPVAEEVEVPDQQEALETPTQETILDQPTPDIELTPSKDKLTEDNVEHLPDASIQPPPTETVASTVASSRDIGSAIGTPAVTSQAQQPIGRPPMGGFATSAYKATAMPGRSASFQRRAMEQQEAVVMPSNHAVDRAAVQFGSMGLNGDGE